jgi:predicted component of type VI protein secretion system
MERNMAARLVVQKGPNPNQEFPLSEAPMSLGRSPDNDIPIQDPEVSRRHALFTFSGGLYQVEDTGSTNGSFVNGRRVQGTVILQHGDILQLGESITLIFQEDTPAAGYADEWADDEWSDDGEWTGADAWEPADVSAPVPPTSEAPTQFYSAQMAQPEQSRPPSVVPPAASFEEASAGPSRSRQLLLGCGCGFLLFGVLCVGLLFFLDAYDQGRLLYCGPLYPFFDALLGPIGFNPACTPPA